MLLCVATFVVVAVAAARAGSCRVLVAIGSVDIEPSPAGMSVRVSGSWEFDNLIQVISGLSYNLLLVRDDNFVRLNFPDQSFSGSVAGLGNAINAGIDGNDIIAVEAAGTTEPGARFVSLEAQKLKVTSPVPPGDGPISVVAYLVLDNDYILPIISNTVTRPLSPEETIPNTDGGTTGALAPAAESAP